jgi:uncharacterized protein (UPF0333 family)
MSRGKAQVSLEFMALVSFMLLFFVIYTPFFWQQQLDMEIEKEYLIGEKLALSVKKEIDTAVMFGTGYKRNFTLSEQISGSDYAIFVENKTLRIFWKDKSTTANLIAHNITGDPQPGFNTLSNRKDVVYLNE